MTGMYQAFMTGDRDRVDAFLDPDATIFDSETPRLACGKADLDRIRDSRPPATEGGGQAVLTAFSQVVDIFDDLAVARYWLRVEFPGLAPELVRNTAVLQRHRDGWLIAHLHEEVHRESEDDVGGPP
ncbi:YybH family protein [Catenulispora subtropica]|uniref:YybH family protein n=1 Tax=Catenulispora subtropica TaxID=450798 RepID=UPI003CD0B178